MLKRDIAKIRAACKPLVKKYDGLIKVLMLFGSTVRARETPADVDLLCIVDDTHEKFSKAVILAINKELGLVKESLEKEAGVHVHLQPSKPLSLWWDMLRSGNPFAFTAMRDALPIYDPAGYVKPLQILLRKGRLAGTAEQVEVLIGRAPSKLDRARRIFLEEVTADLLGALTDAAHAVLMFAGVAPPAARHIGMELRRAFVSKGLLDEHTVAIYEDMFELCSKIEHGELVRLSGRELDVYLSKAVTFIERLEKLFDILDVAKRKRIIEETHELAFDTCRLALKRRGQIPPKKPEQLIAVFKRHFIDTGLVAKEHLEVLYKIHTAKRAADTGKILEVPERDIYASEVYAKNLVRILKKIK
jgi:uncharacterized protein (UPF0332 family)/predicted nucleotidyltransferase